MIRLHVWFCLIVFSYPASAQKLISPRFSNLEQLEKVYATKLNQTQQIDFITPFLEAGLSKNTLHSISLAIAKLKTAQEPVLAKEMKSIEKYRDLSMVNKQKVLALEQQYLGLEKEIEALAQLKNWLTAPATLDKLTQEELSFYQLSQNDIIAEIGTGNPIFAQYLLSSYDPKKYYLNDIDAQTVQNLADYFHFQAPPETQIIPILGESQNTKLEGMEVDGILVRNSIHHFVYLPQMLSSIKKSLSPEGRLLIKETFIESCYGICCSDIISEKDFLKAFESAGFSLIRQTTLFDETATWHLFEFKPSLKK